MLYIFKSVYLDRSLQAEYSDASPGFPVDADSLRAVREFVTDESLRGLHAQKGGQTQVSIAGDPGLRTQFKRADDVDGVLLAYFHGRRVIVLVEYAPTCYADSDTVEAFLSSVQAKP